MAKQKKGSVGAKPKNSKDLNSDLTGNGTYDGELPSIIGKHRILLRGKADYVFVSAHQVESARDRYGKDFVRDLGEVTVDPRPEVKASGVTYLV